MRTFSRWDWSRLEYDYFEDAEPSSPGGWRSMTGLGLESRTRGGRGALGVSIEDALPELPTEARFVGSGMQARGIIVRPRSATDATGDDSGLGALPRTEHSILGAFIMGLGVTIALPLPTALPVFLGGATLGYAMGAAHERDKREGLAGVRRRFKVRKP